MNILFLKKSKILPYVNIDETKFRNKKRNEEYALGRFLAKFGAKIFYGEKKFDIIDEKKAVFKDIALKFSISHSKDIVAVAFDENDIGIDVELMKERVFTQIAEFLKIPSKNKLEFYQHWTCFEAQYKSLKQNLTSFIFENYMFSLSFAGEISNRPKIYEVVMPKNITAQSELINLKLVIESNKNDNALELQEINTASLDFLPPLTLNIE